MKSRSTGKLNVLVDGFVLLPGTRGAGGAGRYFHSLLREWNLKPPGNIRVTVSPINFNLFEEYKNLDIVVVPNQEHWAYDPHFDWADVYVSLLNGLWPRITPPRLPVVVCIHDLQHLSSPQFFNKETWGARNKDYGFAIRRANRLIAISQQEADNLRRFYGRTDVDVVNHGPYIADFLGTGALHRKEYVLYPAVQWPHKNHVNLVYAWAIYRNTLGGPEELVLTGASDHDLARQGLKHLVERLRLSDSVDILGYQPDDRMATLVKEAKALVFPSLYEGFGIPVLEAMHLGTPTIASNLDALREVGGDTIAYFEDPLDPYRMALDLSEFLGHADRLKNLSTSGVARAQRFSTAKMAQETFDTIAKAALASAAPANLAPVKETIPPFRDGPALSVIVLLSPSRCDGGVSALVDQLRGMSSMPAPLYCYAPADTAESTLRELHDVCRAVGARLRVTASVDRPTMMVESLTQHYTVERGTRYVLVQDAAGDLADPVAVRVACAELDYYEDLGAAFFDQALKMSVIKRPMGEEEAYSYYMKNKEQAADPFFGAIIRSALFSNAGVPGTKKFLAYFLKNASYLVVASKGRQHG